MTNGSLHAQMDAHTNLLSLLGSSIINQHITNINSYCMWNVKCESNQYLFWKLKKKQQQQQQQQLKGKRNKRIVWPMNIYIYTQEKKIVLFFCLNIVHAAEHSFIIQIYVVNMVGVMDFGLDNNSHHQLVYFLFVFFLFLFLFYSSTFRHAVGPLSFDMDWSMESNDRRSHSSRIISNRFAKLFICW